MGKRNAWEALTEPGNDPQNHNKRVCGNCVACIGRTTIYTGGHAKQECTPRADAHGGPPTAATGGDNSVAAVGAASNAHAHGQGAAGNTVTLGSELAASDFHPMAAPPCAGEAEARAGEAEALIHHLDQSGAGNRPSTSPPPMPCPQ